MNKIYIVEDSEWDIDNKYFISESKEKCNEYLEKTNNQNRSRMIILEYELNIPLCEYNCV